MYTSTLYSNLSRARSCHELKAHAMLRAWVPRILVVDVILPPCAAVCFTQLELRTFDSTRL